MATLTGVSLLVAVGLVRYPDTARAADHVAVVGAVPGVVTSDGSAAGPHPLADRRIDPDSVVATTVSTDAVPGGASGPLVPVDPVPATAFTIAVAAAPPDGPLVEPPRPPAPEAVAPPVAAASPAPEAPATDPRPAASPAPAAAEPTPAAVTPPAPAPAPAPSGNFADGLEWSSLSLLNQERAAAGLAPLAFDGGLRALARSQAQAMADAGSLFHQNLYGVLGYGWGTAGENVGRGGSVGGLHVAFVNSGVHYANIVGSGFTHVGVGVLVAPDGGLWLVQVFGG